MDGFQFLKFRICENNLGPSRDFDETGDSIWIVSTREVRTGDFDLTQCNGLMLLLMLPAFRFKSFQAEIIPEEKHIFRVAITVKGTTCNDVHIIA